MEKRKRIYLDYAATTPVDPGVFKAMSPYFRGKFGNPGSLHGFGQEAVAAVDRSRETIARVIGAEFREVIFTASATEANNLVLRGIVRKSPNLPKPRIVVSAIEHESILETARDLEKEGVEVVSIPVDRRGIVDLEKLKHALNRETLLVSVMYANNEMGSIQPIAQIAKIVRDFREEGNIDARSASFPLLHVDAAQAFQFLDCNVKDLDIDFMTLSAHKIYGPKGAGCLYARSSASLQALISGGGQEFGFRSGTENVPAIVGFAEASKNLSKNPKGYRKKRIESLREQLWRGIKKISPKAELNSPFLFSRAICLPNILNVYFPGHNAEGLLMRADLCGLAISSGSACRSRAMESSYVIQALGYSKERAKSSIRFSLGSPTTQKEIDAALKTMKKILLP